ncbi:MAG: ABC transporter ATP-binding protein [Planctomycetes bacterium]|nr:ABC transporter ATP-binding protein [Planctomycetota bacterium]NUQ35174.1 ABC transporter ATP-binding protein [Planctomycetaceae bacterium]
MPHPALEIEDLHVSYGEKEVVKGISFTIQPGELVGYLGPNGAGKSTTLKAVVGMVRPSSGGIGVAGANAICDIMNARQLTGFLHESGAVYDVLTPREHFALIADLRRIERAKLLRRGEELLDFLDLPIDARDRRMQEFSKGMKQKVAISAALLHDPPLLLLDEPINGLDVNATSRFKELLLDYVRRGNTVLYSSHLLDVVERVCKRVIIINQGKVLADLAMDTIRQSHPGKTLEQLFQELTGYEPVKAESVA